jgi:hypothetical protein
MGWLAAIGTTLQIAWYILQKWGSWSDEKKITATNILKEGQDAVKNNDIGGITMFFDRIHRL